MTGAVLYIVAISFQLTGAIFLISNFLPTKTQIIHETAKDEAALHWGELKENGQTKITYTAGELSKGAETACQNFYALILIILGYLLGVFGEIGDKLCSLIMIVVLSTILIAVGKGICALIARKMFKGNASVNE